MSFLVVVKRDEESLFSYLQQHFQEAEVTVIRDRREKERRRQPVLPPDDRRQSDRRGGASDADPLWKYGFRVTTAQD